MKHLADLVARIHAATTPAQIGSIYEELVGYDSHAEDPTATLADLRGLALDYVREICAAQGIPCGHVGVYQFTVGDEVQFIEPLPEDAARYVVVEMRGDRVLVEALGTGMHIAPQSVYPCIDLMPAP